MAGLNPERFWELGDLRAALPRSSLKAQRISNARPLLEKLQSLQCHFTWDIKLDSLVEVDHLLLFLAYKCNDTAYGNRSLYLALKAYLHCQQRRYAEALRSLLAAEEMVMQDHPASIPLHNLVIYGNYAWIYYRLANFPKVEFYLAKIHRVCRFLNSPQPYSVMTPEIMAQKGWSLLTAQAPQDGGEAMRCFQTALRDDPSNEEFKAGFAISHYSLWECFRTADHRDKAKALLEEIVQMDPQNYEAKLYLADVLLRLHQERGMWYLEEVVQNSLSADVLKHAASVCLRTNPGWLYRSISILKKAISLEPNYHLLYYYLGMYYKYYMLGEVSPAERPVALQPAAANLQRAVEVDYLSVFPILELARIYNDTNPAYEEEVYLRLVDDLPAVSKLHQQTIYISWGDFLLHKKRQKHQALETFMAGLKISGGRLEEKNSLKKRLVMLADMFQEDSDMDQVDVIHSFLQTMEREEGDSHTEVLGAGDEGDPSPSLSF